VATAVDGQGITVTVHFTKKEGAPVCYVADGSTPAAAIRPWESAVPVRSHSAVTLGSMTTRCRRGQWSAKDKDLTAKTYDYALGADFGLVDAYLAGHPRSSVMPMCSCRSVAWSQARPTQLPEASAETLGAKVLCGGRGDARSAA
jgi:hypothetical protein